MRDSQINFQVWHVLQPTTTLEGFYQLSSYLRNTQLLFTYISWQQNSQQLVGQMLGRYGYEVETYIIQKSFTLQIIFSTFWGSRMIGMYCRQCFQQCLQTSVIVYLKSKTKQQKVGTAKRNIISHMSTVQVMLKVLGHNVLFFLLLSVSLAELTTTIMQCHGWCQQSYCAEQEEYLLTNCNQVKLEVNTGNYISCFFILNFQCKRYFSATERCTDLLLAHKLKMLA